MATTSRSYLLQRLNRAVLGSPEAVTANIVAVHRHVGGDVVADPVPTRDGAFLVGAGDERWRAFGAVRHAGPLALPTAASARSAGDLVGRFHARLADLDPDTVAVTMPGFHDLRRRLEALRQAAGEDRWGRLATVAEEVDTVLASSPLVDVAEELGAGVPRRVAHNDAKLDNVLFRADEAVRVVDLDTVMPGAWFWDVGDLLRTAATRAAEDEASPDAAVVAPDLYEAVMGGYRHGVSQGPVTGAELEALEAAGAVVTYEQALRFLTDWLSGDVYYRTSRPGHNRDRARAQVRLFASMPRPAWSR